MGAGEDDGVERVGFVVGESGVNNLGRELVGVDLSGPIGAIWFIDANVGCEFGFKVLIVCGLEGGGSGEDEDPAGFGEL